MVCNFIGASLPLLKLVEISNRRAFARYSPKVALTFQELFLNTRPFYQGGRLGSPETIFCAVQHCSYNREKTFNILDPKREFQGDPDFFAMPTPDYIFVPQNKEDEFVQHATEFVKSHYPTVRNNPDYTSIIHLNHYERLKELIRDAEEKGAKVVEINPANEDFSQQEFHKMPPTIILNPTDDMKVMKEEIFGPVLPIKTYSEFNDTVKYINRNPKALALYYFGDDKKEIDNILDNTTSGQAVINEVLFQFSMHDLPFGGVGPSGMGAYHGYDGFKNFSHKRSILKGQNVLNAGEMISAPYTEATEKNIRRFN